LTNLRNANKNERRQQILQSHIARLFEKLTVLKMSIKMTTVAASVAIGMLAFVPQDLQAQSFSVKEINPFSLANVYSESAPTFADLDGDGDYDMLAGSDYGVYNYTTYTNEYQFQYFENVGTASNPIFAAPVSNPFGITSPNTYGELAPTFVDIDTDGDMDIVYGNYYAPHFYFIENTGTPTAPAFGAPQTNPFGLTDTPSGYSTTPSFADLDNDGDLDLLTGDYYGEFYYFENTGTSSVPAFAAPQTNPFGITSIDRSAPTLIDIDGDGDFDLLSGDGDGNFYYFENTGTSSVPAFAAPQTNPFGLTFVGGSSYYSSGQSKPTFVDIDDDGDLDLMAGDNDGDFNFYRQCTPSTSTISPTAVCSYTSPTGQYYTSSGIFTSVLTNSTGCDSIITINLTIEPVSDQTVSSLNPFICGTEGTAIIDLGSSQNGVNYYLRNNTNDSIIDGPFVGNGSAISFTTDTISAPTTYNVYGDRPTNTTGIFFDGMNVSNQKVDCGNAGSVQLSGNQITLEAWIYPTAWKSVNQGHIINKENNGPGTDYGYMIRCGDGGKINFNLGNGNWNELTTTTTPLALNTWQHVAATYDGAVMKIYVDGNLIETKNDPSINFSSSLQNLTIGSWAGGTGSVFPGNIDEVRVWSVAKTQGELQADMSNCLSGTETGLAAYYQFEDGAGSSTLTDLSPNGNDGTLQNMDPNTVWSLGSAVCSSCNLEMSQTITINIGQATANSISPTACNTYTSPSGNYVWDASGIYMDTIPNISGCDSVITVNLTIDSLDNTVAISGNVLTANQTGASYQWLDCDNANAPIATETNQSFTATVNGNYAVVVTVGSCSDTSICENITGVGIKEVTTNVVSIYPNPTSGLFTVRLANTKEAVSYTITTLEGRLVEQANNVTTNNIEVDLTNESKGVYFLIIQENNTNTTYKIIKQ
tara:strand:+ start:5005 stop:7788 length:2784 start_codon:yes stop_codon:yes gene_type:complete